MQLSQARPHSGMANKAPVTVLYETLVLLAVAFGAQRINAGLGTLASFLAIGYLLVERYGRHRAWAELGLTWRGFTHSLARNWPLILLVSFVMQFGVAWVAANYWPALLDHIVARLPFDLSQLAAYLPLLLLATLMEELVYRALFQERLSWFMPLPTSIGLVTLIFGLAHLPRATRSLWRPTSCSSCLTVCFTA
jgi:membrane protease YdiL (CAAX protease family)